MKLRWQYSIAGLLRVPIHRTAKLDAATLVISAPDASGVVTIRGTGLTAAQVDAKIKTAIAALDTTLRAAIASAVPQQPARLVGGPSGIISVDYNVNPPEVEANAEVLRKYLGLPLP